MKESTVHTRVKNRIRGQTPRAGGAAKLVLVALVVTLGLLAAAGCGGSSKPAYCSDKSKLQDDVQSLTDSVKSGDISSLQSQLSTIKTDTTTLESSAKSDFPSQTTAIKTSVDTLSSSVDALPANPTTDQIAALAVQAATVVSSIQSFSDATSSKCG
jgi:hypothetical protein